MPKPKPKSKKEEDLDAAAPPAPLTRVCGRRYRGVSYPRHWWLKYPARLVAGRQPYPSAQVAIELWGCAPEAASMFDDREPTLSTYGPEGSPFLATKVAAGVYVETISRPHWTNRENYPAYLADGALPAAKELAQLVRATAGRRATAPIEVLVDALLDPESPAAPVVPPFFRYRLAVLLGLPPGRRRYPKTKF